MKLNFKKLILPASMFLAAQSHALGLGPMQVDSALDEVLDAEIPLVIGDGELVEELKVTLASNSDYEKVGLDKSFVPINIKVDVAGEGNDQYIKLSSLGAVSEPIVTLLLVVDWKNGRLLREYTLLLDPPVFSGSQVQTVTTSTVQTQSFNDSIDTDDVTVDDAESEVANTYTDSTDYSDTDSSQSEPVSFNSEQSVVVEAGDTLWRIANRFRSSDVNPQQMMVAIFNQNPQAFSNNDMNQLKRGARLTIPTQDEASAISFQQALSEVKAQTENYSPVSQNSSSSDSSSDVDYGIEIVPPRNADASDSSTSSGSSSDERLNDAMAELSQTKEQLASATLENEELSSRVEDLEKIVQDQELALNMKDDDLAQLQQQIADNQALLNSQVSDDENTQITEVVEDSMQDVVEDLDSASTDNSDDVWDTDDSLAVTDENGTDTSTDTNESTDTNQADSSETLTIVDDSETQGDNNTQQDTPPPVTPKEESLMDTLMRYKTEGLIGLGVLVAAIGGFFFMRSRRREEYDAGESFLDSIKSDSSSDEFSSEELNSEDLVDDMQDTEEDSLSDIIEDVDEAIESLDDDLDDLPAVTVMDDDSKEDDIEDLVNDSEEVLDLMSEDADEDSDLMNDLESDFDLDDADDDFMQDTDDGSDDMSEESAEDDELGDLDFESIDLDSDEDSAQADTTSVDDFDAELDSFLEGVGGDSEEPKQDQQELDLGDFEMDLDVSDEDTETEEKNSAEEYLENDISLDLDLDSDNSEFDEVAEDSSELEEMVFDTGEVAIVGDDSSHDEDDELDLDFDSDEDLDIGLDLDDLIPQNDAVDTKLDLAKAYFEMGDLDGAIQMVTEIFEEGTEEQQAKAQQLKDEIEKSSS